MEFYFGAQSVEHLHCKNIFHLFPETVSPVIWIWSFLQGAHSWEQLGCTLSLSLCVHSSGHQCEDPATNVKIQPPCHPVVFSAVNWQMPSYSGLDRLVGCNICFAKIIKLFKCLCCLLLLTALGSSLHFHTDLTVNSCQRDDYFSREYFQWKLLTVKSIDYPE